MASTARGLISQLLGVVLALFGVYTLVTVSAGLVQVFTASRQDLPDRAMLATYGIATVVINLVIITIGVALIAHRDQFRWRNVPEVFTKTSGRRRVFRIVCFVLSALFIAGLLAQNSWVSRIGYALAIFIVQTAALRVGLPRPTTNAATLAPAAPQPIPPAPPPTGIQETPVSLITEHSIRFHGLPVQEFVAGNTPVPANHVAWRISVPSYDAEEQWPDLFTKFLGAVDPTTVTALIVGSWADPYDHSSAEIVDALLAAAPQLPNLRALFIGDMTSEDCEISWIRQSDLTPLLTGFEELEELVIRGGTDLQLQSVQHSALQRLAIESGGLPASVVRAVAASDLPALIDLELWLGTKEYGADSTVQDLAPILTGEHLPSLTRLALRNSDYEDQIAVAAATAPAIAQLKNLDLSMGVLTDTGAQALLTGQSLTHLTTLNLAHNYLSEDIKSQLQTALESAGVQLNLESGDADEYEFNGEIYRTTAVGE
ncbi:STM4015 family protein [Mycobacteroides abscessus]|uniref:STM4015 family protein n=1 Tax=Mycobacteroides abscessus TaxID=36809 RepID=UPI001F3356FA|nr:STM4015 family protein [Mycobacteroides abscessus]